jgi:hypothetical protein
LVAQRWSGVASTLRPLRSATFGAKHGAVRSSDNCETVLKLFRLLNAPNGISKKTETEFFLSKIWSSDFNKNGTWMKNK